jgi:hypothetical protein
MRHTGSFNPEWGYLAPAPSLLRRVRLVVMASAIAATASAAITVALVHQPTAEASVAARTLVPLAETPSAPPASGLADLRFQSDHAPTPGAEHVAAATRRQSAPARPSADPSSVYGLRIASVPRPEPNAAKLEASGAAAMAAAARPMSAPPISARPMSKVAAPAIGPTGNVKTSNINVRGAAQPKSPAADASRLRMASAQPGNKPAARSAVNDGARNTVAPNRDKKAPDDDSLLTRTKGVTDHVIAATQRAVSTIGVIPSWIGSMGNRLGG